MKQHEDYFGTDLVVLNHGQMERTTPQLAPPLETSTPHQSFPVHACGLYALWVSRWTWIVGIRPAGGRLVTTYDLTRNRLHTRWIFNGIGFRISNPSAPKAKPYY
ncbi:hypothetical protein AVEN_196709-1 [Araneus ventricosus]|uniref:Uncharacterized protein n=1 Tax=Araneus ventricosus TaxID=182803 RepID=A0A4Y2GZE2_ARAVE|nr:hypothetical protein AVEN_196709-1 [Araneus ventricosus]